MKIQILTIGLMAVLVSGGTAQSQAERGPAARPLAGKVAIITGGARNLGRGYALGLADMGADVVIHHHQPDDRAEADETARQIRARGVRTMIVAGDLCQVANIRRIFDATVAALGRVDIVVNSAGRMVKKPLANVTEQEFDSVFCMNAKGTFFMMQEAAKRVAANGRIINIGTSLQAGVTPEYSVYAGSKASLEPFTRALAREVGARGITVNLIAPGPVDTSFYRGPESPESIAYATRLAVAGRLGKVDDIVPLVQFLASPGSQWVTAQTLFINGGYAAR